MAEPKEAVRIAALNWQGTISKLDFVMEIPYNVLLQQELTPEHKASADSEASNDDIHEVLQFMTN